MFIKLNFRNCFIGSSNPQKTEHEYPPSWARIFKALVDIYHNNVEHFSSRTQEHGLDALRWLENEKPVISYNENFVVSNYTKKYVPKSYLDNMKVTCGKIENTTKVVFHVSPLDPLFYEISDNQQYEEVLAEILSFVNYIGKRGSLVEASLEKTFEKTNNYISIFPKEDGEIKINCTYKGYLDNLKSNYDNNIQDTPFKVECYSQYKDIEPSPYFDVKVYGFNGTKLYYHQTEKIGGALRGHFLKEGSARLKGIIGKKEHVNLDFLSLPFVNHEYADGEIKAFAICIPKKHACLHKDIHEVFCKSPSFELLFDAGKSFAKIELIKAPDIKTADIKNWSKPSRFWKTVTPMATIYPKGKEGQNKLKTWIIALYLVFSIFCYLVYFPIDFSMNKAQNGHLAWNWLNFPIILNCIWLSFVIGVILYQKKYLKFF